MKVTLKDLKPNRTRDMRVDPIDQEQVRALTASIKDDGFWGGVVVARDHDGYEIVAGHSRVAAAIRAGMAQADVFVLKDVTDDRRAHIYAVENATQRGNEGTAQAGSVAAAIYVLARVLAKGEKPCTRRIGAYKAKAWAKVLDHFQRDGIGHRLIADYLGQEVISAHEAEAQLGNLKASGDYDRIVARAVAEIAAETPEPIPAVARAEEVVKERKRRAQQQPPDFDLTGVSRHLKNPKHVAAFRKEVTGPGVKPYLPKDKQAMLAEQIVKKADEANRELSVAFIREQMYPVLRQEQAAARKYDRDQQAELERRDLDAKARRLLDDFGRNARGVVAAGIALLALWKRWPKGLAFPMTDGFRRDLRALKDVIDQTLNARM